MFVKTLWKDENGYWVPTIHECISATFRHTGGTKAELYLMPQQQTLEIMFDKAGNALTQVYYMNNEGKTIEKVA